MGHPDNCFNYPAAPYGTASDKKATTVRVSSQSLDQMPRFGCTRTTATRKFLTKMQTLISALIIATMVTTAVADDLQVNYYSNCDCGSYRSDAW
jgi:hypothetical protein